MRRVRLVVAAVSVVALGASAALAATAFDDVGSGSFYEDATAWAKDEGLTVGCNSPDGSTPGSRFCPNSGVNRAQNITFTYRHQTLVIDPLLDDIRGDVAAAAAAADAAQAAADAAPAQVVWVAGSGGDFTSLSAALASITDASASKPYVVRIAPGEYAETSTVALKDHVDVEGSGEGVTTITCACGGADSDAAAATVSAGDIAAEIRHVTIENTGGDTYSTGIWTQDVADESMSMLHVTATATGGSSYNYGVANYQSSPSMNNVTAEGHADGAPYARGVYNTAFSSPSMTNVTATATGGTSTNVGVYNAGTSSPPPSIRSSALTGSTNSILTLVGQSAYVADTMLDGPVGGGGTNTCTGAYTAAFVVLDATCN